MKQKVSLGDRVNGQIEVVALGVTFAEVPATFKYDKYLTYKSIYLEVTQDVLKEIDAYYLSLKSGDKAEGISNSQPYYKILGIKYYDGMFQQTMSYRELQEEYSWGVYTNFPEKFKNVSILVEIL